MENYHKNNITHQKIRALCEEYLGSIKTDVNSDGTAWIVSKGQGATAKRVVLKLMEKKSVIQTASRMCSIHEKVRCLVAGEDRSIVPILGHNDESNAIIMDYVDGFPVLKLLQKALFTRRGKIEATNALEKTGSILADINSIEEENIGIKTKGRSNESYIDDFNEIAKEIKVSNYLVNGGQDLTRFVSGFSKDWKERTPKHLIAVDVQPKNVFLTTGGIVLIDPDYAIGNPAMNIAQVLVSIDQLGMKFPLRGHIRIIEEWKKHFLLAYKQSENAYPWVDEDLAFFYPWALLQSYVRHIGYRPMFAKYFARWYRARVGKLICRQSIQSSAPM